MSENLDAYKEAYTEKFPYHWDEELLLRAYAKKLVEQLGQRRELRVLSLGIGAQRISQTIREELSVSEYHILEGSNDIIERYRSETSPPPSVTVHHTYFETAEFDAPFDAIEMGFVLEHVDDPGFILRKFRKLLKPEGLLFVAVPNARSLHRLLGHSAGYLKDLYALSQYDLQLGHKRYFDSKAITQLVRDSGYTILEDFGLALKPLTTGQLQQLALDDRVERALIEVGYENPDIANGILLIASVT
jgi:2-polyprenyl-3-methyl-5-hydroxy-6-metoxy-1,4-benzoquinol methylase